MVFSIVRFFFILSMNSSIAGAGTKNLSIKYRGAPPGAAGAPGVVAGSGALGPLPIPVGRTSIACRKPRRSVWIVAAVMAIAEGEDRHPIVGDLFPIGRILENGVGAGSRPLPAYGNLIVGRHYRRQLIMNVGKGIDQAFHAGPEGLYTVGAAGTGEILRDKVVEQDHIPAVDALVVQIVDRAFVLFHNCVFLNVRTCCVLGKADTGDGEDCHQHGDRERFPAHLFFTKVAAGSGGKLYKCIDLRTGNGSARVRPVNEAARHITYTAGKGD